MARCAQAHGVAHGVLFDGGGVVGSPMWRGGGAVCSLSAFRPSWRKPRASHLPRLRPPKAPMS
eukprot:2598453-Alexandrium_andersonii.AAC.1